MIVSGEFESYICKKSEPRIVCLKTLLTNELKCFVWGCNDCCKLFRHFGVTHFSIISDAGSGRLNFDNPTSSSRAVDRIFVKALRDKV